MNWWDMGQREFEALLAQTGAGASLIHQASVTLTNQGLKDYSDGIANVPLTGLPGAQRQLEFHTGRLYADFSAGFYTNLDTSDAFLGFKVGNNTVSNTLLNGTFSGTPIVEFSTLFETASIQTVLFQGAQALYASANRIQASNYLDSYSANQPLTLQIYNGLGKMQGGHADNWARATASFLVFDLTLGKFLTTVESGWQESTRTFS